MPQEHHLVAQVSRPRLRHRLVAVYAGMVVVPVGLAWALLTFNGVPHTASQTALPVHFDTTVARTLLTVAIVVGLCKLAGWLAPRVGQPPVVGEIATGIVLGPSVFGALWPQGAQWLVPPQVLPGLNILAELGVVLFVFLTGLDLDLSRLRGRGPMALAVGHSGMAVPFLLGVTVAGLGAERFTPPGSNFVAYSLFLGVALAVTALPVLARILTDTELQHTSVGMLAMTCAATTDATAWFVLAAVLALAGTASAWGAVATVMGTVAFAGVLLLVLRPLLARSVAWSRLSERPAMVLPVAVVAALLSAVTTELMGVHAMVGAFLFGLAMPVRDEIRVWLREHIGVFTNTVLLPLFFAVVGMGTQIGSLGADLGAWAWFAVILVTAVGSKFGGSAIAARAMGTSVGESLQIGVLMNCRGLTELVVLGIGMQLGLLTQQLFTILVLVALVSTAMTTPLIRLLQRDRWSTPVHSLHQSATSMTH